MNKFEKACNILREMNCDGWLIVCNEQSDIHSEFMLGIKTHARHYIYISADGHHVIYSVPMEVPMIKRVLDSQSIHVKVEPYESMEELKNKLRKILNNKRIALNYGEIFNSEGNTEYADHLRVGDYFALNSLASNIEFISAAPIVYQLRAIKNEKDLEDLRETCKVTMEILNIIPDWVKIGMTEKEVKARLEHEYMKIGEPSFETIIASGIHSADPHHNTSQKKIKKGVLLIDTGLKINRMCSDITWTFWVGTKPSEQFIDAYSILLKAKEISLKYYKDGEKNCTPAIECREFLSKEGYDPEKLFIHGLGHSIGFQVHDVGARISKSVSKKEILKENMIYSNEPGLYWKNQWGIRIEDDIIIKKEKCERVTLAPKEPLLI
ncbi:MAG: M24 family metallopeptidase [Promethearchaeota archaeon]